ncbi:2Fe-2S iron-sulfur cluster binding domain-containing protein [Gordonia sp. OPL2]|uniref:2Fe-2S iron-sulfur cluster-binding protein n=1 Tax=Gordonia sp. OPL2 TaxID=2486274 RepID=UPI0016564CC6|nr:2Fe-2S iron-sulfur cluster binding domain-containing protein [Gordonia sp. OPL2]ROZ88015.1 (2Fe-2S)-binding protein [Gordonia sp. OPL2]
MAVSAEFVGHDSEVDCEPDETLLRAGLRAGLALPYECASGGCGSCRAQLLGGDVRSLWPEASGLSERDRRRGNRILMCQSVPTGNCRVKAPALGDPQVAEEPVPQRFRAILVRREMLTEDTALFTLAFQNPIRYLPGQFMILESRDGVRRAYSMAHPASELGSGQVEFIIRAKPGGAGSQWLFATLTPDAELIAEGPYGRAYARPTSDRPVVCIAGGTGLAPVLAIAECLLRRQDGPAIDFYFGVRRRSDLVVVERLEKLQTSGARVLVSVQEAADTADRLDTGLVTRAGVVIDHVAEDWQDLSSHDVYLAGPSGMVDAAMRSLVRERHACADRVYFDRFLS